MLPIAVVDMDIRSPESLSRPPEVADRLVTVDCYDLTGDGAVLQPYAGVIIPAMVDQEHLTVFRLVISGYLDRGGVVVFGGHLFRPWLPGAGDFVPLEVRSHRDYEVAWLADHPIFAGVLPADLTYRRGVAGFFARGHHPPPEGAEVLARLAGGQPITYVDRVSSVGTILVHTSADLLGYHGIGSTADRVPGQLLDWIGAEATRRRGEVGVAR